jgi:hypothetical protein
MTLANNACLSPARRAKPVLTGAAVVLLALFVAGCNFTSQSYNYGKLLDPGATLVTVGAGSRKFYAVRWQDTLQDSVMSYRKDTTIHSRLSLCLDYRLGVLRKLPFGQGLEVGFHLEGPVQYNPTDSIAKTGEYLGPMALELDCRLGIKDFSLGKGIFHHNVAVGWTIGEWIDNGWYAEYAAGWEYQWLTPYVDFRAELLATDPTSDDSLTESYTPFKYEKRSWTTRTAAGVAIRLPHISFLLPDYVSPEVSFICPHYSGISQYGITYHIGLRWLNGI